MGLPEPEWAPIRWTHDDDAAVTRTAPFSDKEVFLTQEPCMSSCETPCTDLLGERPSLWSTSNLPDLDGTHDSCASLKIWLAGALERHQDAAQKHIEQKLGQLMCHLDESLAKIDAKRTMTWQSESGVSSPERRSLEVASWSMAGARPSRGQTIEECPEVLPADNGQHPRYLSGVSTLCRRVMSSQRAREAWEPLKSRWATSVLDCVNKSAIIMVVLNALVLYLQLDHKGAEIAMLLGQKSSMGIWGDLDVLFHWADHLFNAFFVFELVVKLVILRCSYFNEFMNTFDGTIVLLNCFSLWFQDGSGNTVLARLARVFKVMRVARVSRVSRISHELRVLLSTTLSSMRSLIWSAVLLGIIIIISAMAMAQVVTMYLSGGCEQIDNEVCQWAYHHYGGASRAAWTMFKVTLSGGWPQWADILVDEVSVVYVFFWILYIVVVWFAVIRILTALFLKQTMEAAAADYEMQLFEKTRKKSQFRDKLHEFFVQADTNKDGVISLQEFTFALANGDTKAWLSSQDIEPYEFEALFHMLDDGEGAISFEELVGGAARLKGAARSIDNVTIIHNQARIMKVLEEIIERKPCFVAGP